jgi:hypothetical protein
MRGSFGRLGFLEGLALLRPRASSLKAIIEPGARTFQISASGYPRWVVLHRAKMPDFRRN